MENTIFSGQDPTPAYDYRAYDQVWQRVTPGVDPYAGDAMNPNPAPVPAPAPVSAPTPIPAPASAAQPAPRQESGGAVALPGAEQDPCCMGTNAQESTLVLEGFIQEELAGCRQCQRLAGCTRHQAAAQLFRRIAREKHAAAQELSGAYYLITGTCFAPSVTVERTRWCNLAAALRSCYHQEACAGLNYSRAADETTDKCLTDLFNKLGMQSYQRAEDVLSLLGRVVC